MTAQLEPVEQRRSLAYLPVGVFAMVMGLGGASVVWQRAHHAWSVAAVVAQALAWLALGALVALAATYGLKAARHPAAVVAEWRHPVQSAFAAATAAVGATADSTLGTAYAWIAGVRREICRAEPAPAASR